MINKSDMEENYWERTYCNPKNLKEIFDLDRRINVCTEFEGYYYIQVSIFKEGENLDGKIIEETNNIYKIDKKTGEITPCSLDFIGYKIDIEPKATPVDPETLRKRVS